MSLLELSQLAEIAGVIAVIGSLIYVGVQLKQNTTALHAQSRQSVLTASQAELLGGVNVPGAALLVTKETGLTREENITLNNWYLAVMRTRMFAWLQYQDRIIDAHQWEEELIVIQILFSTRRGRSWWQKLGRGAFTASFVNLVDEALSDRPVSDEYFEMQASWSAQSPDEATG